MVTDSKIFLYDNKYSIHYHDTGSGEPIVFVHGLGAASYGWRFISESLVKKYRLVSLDLRGFGMSDKPTKSIYSLKHHAEVLIALIQHLNLRNITVVGHSLGGAVVLTAYLVLSLNLSKEHNVKSLVLMDALAYRYKIPWYLLFFKIPVLNSLLINRYTISFVISPILSRIGRKRLFFDERMVDDKMAKAYSGYIRQDGAQYALVRTMEQTTPQSLDAISNELTNINIPVLVLWGEHDKALPVSLGEKLNSDISGSKWVVIKDCGHNPHEECPSETANAILSFLNNLENQHD